MDDRQDERLGQEGRAADEHDQSEGPHAEARSDADVQRKRHQQHERPPHRFPHEGPEREFPRDRRVRHELRDPRIMHQPRHVVRLVFEVGERQPHRIAGPPRRAQQLRNPGEEIDHAHLGLDQPQCDVGRHRRLRRRRPHGRKRTPDETVDRECGPRRTDAAIKCQKPVDLVEPEERTRRAVHVGNDDHERQDGRHPRGRTEREEDEHGQRGIVRGPEEVGRDVPPVGPGDLIALHRLDQFGRQPGVGTEKGFQLQAPDEMRVDEHQAGGDADEREERGVGRGEPEAIPFAFDFGRLPADAADGGGQKSSHE